MKKLFTVLTAVLFVFAVNASAQEPQTDAAMDNGTKVEKKETKKATKKAKRSHKKKRHAKAE